MSFGDVAAEAIRFARDGFPIYPLRADMIALHETDHARWPSNAAIYLPGGRPPRAGKLFVRSTSRPRLDLWSRKSGRI